jgi:hypothetical protein
LFATIGGSARVRQMRVAQAQADDAGALADQRGHHRHGDAVGRDDEVALVLAVVVVLQDDGAALADRVERDPQAGGQVRESGSRHG